MADGRNTDNKIRIWSLLVLFAVYNGEIDSDRIKENEYIFKSKSFGGQTPFQTFMTVTKELNKHLKKYFDIPDSIYIGTYKKMFKNEQSLEKFFPKLFANTDTGDAKIKIDTQRTISKMLGKKGYAMRIKIAYNLERPMQKQFYDHEKETPLHTQEAEANAKRVRLKYQEAQYTDLRKPNR